MDFSFDILQIYRRYCDTTSREITDAGESYGSDEELHKGRNSREALAELLKVVETNLSTRVSIIEVLYKLMSRLDLMAEFSEFSCFYDFVFFICRENGQRSITVSRAVMAWRIVLSGRFRLLNQWCNFVEKNQQHNIYEDTWRQVLAFSRCVHENLEGYDPEGISLFCYHFFHIPEGAWPVLIDDFVEYMYRIRGSSAAPNLCDCGDSEPQPREETLPVLCLKNFPGSKRKLDGNMHMDEKSSDGLAGSSSVIANYKRRHVNIIKKPRSCVDITKHNSSHSLLGSNTKSHCAVCAVEGCLSRGFADLLSSHSCLQFDRRVSYT